MAFVELRGISKRYDTVHALQEVSLAVEAGEFFTLLGPSGCGKTTLLRTVAGFIKQDSGEVLVGGSSVDRLPPHRRDTGMVFQDYAIFPHMSVAQNVAFGLRNRRVERADVGPRVASALRTVRLSEYDSRMPHELSGGQQQRVGLARAMVIRPQVLLMDEPLSNLDAKLRIELREDIRDIQHRLGITTLYVTHDQEEALVVSDRICVMRQGNVEQVGTPWEVYKQPQTRFAASFVGRMNFLERLPEQTASPAALSDLEGAQEIREALERVAAGAAVAAIRPEDLLIVQPGGRAPARALEVGARVEKVSFTGREAEYFVRAPQDVGLTVHVTRPTETLVAAAGATVTLALPFSSLLFFDAGSGKRI